MSFDFDKLRSNVSDAISQAIDEASSSDAVTLRHNGIVVTVPYREGASVRVLVTENSTPLALTGGTPSVTMPGNPDPIDVEQQVRAGGIYDCFSDKKENAAS